MYARCMRRRVERREGGGDADIGVCAVYARRMVGVCAAVRIVVVVRDVFAVFTWEEGRSEGAREGRREMCLRGTPVSYTHLTLPTKA